MVCFRPLQGIVAGLALLLSPGSFGQQTPAAKAPFPYPQKLTYRIEWRLITAGSAVMEITNANAAQWHTKLDIQSAGIMSRLYRVSDTYQVSTDGKFCGLSAEMNAEEGKRSSETRLAFDNTHHKLKYDEHDRVRNTTKHLDLDIPACTHEITGALTSLRMTTIEPGKSITLPISDGKKVANARIESQAREKILVDGKPYDTLRYEAFLFDNVLYRRKGRLLMWLTDDSEHLPVQMRLQMGFPIGNVAIILEKHGQL